ncbi:hypothetical protein YIM1640_02210 [Thermus oshimai]|uniref:Septum formation initiator n=1 Tax=Thermus oshimai JL-2 TaxID=751945 RepID=K7QZ93_THEOS|nr:hypothetical protein [Thermus oshimai]AFV76165.1 hypothetical protein Theos_1120 [Thermus oshimai JL-2]
MRTAVRFGLLYLLALLLLFAFGHRNQMERARLERLERRIEALKAEEARLLKARWSLTPHRILDWAERNGLVPMSEGRWGR